MGSFSIWHWLIFAAIVYFVARALGFAKKTPKAAEGGLIPKVRGNGSFSFEVVGESHYQAAFSQAFHEYRAGVCLKHAGRPRQNSVSDNPGTSKNPHAS
jgi:hypothetical protein